jgi:AcrR family transcriptional regulator
MASGDGERCESLAAEERILDAALETFARDGIRSATFRTVSERAGVPEASVRERYGSKDDLLLAVLGQVDASFPETEAWVAEPGGGLETLRRIPATAAVLAERPELTRLRVVVSAEAMVRNGAARHYTQHRTEAILRWLMRALKEGVRRGEISPDVDVKARATEVVTFTEGIQVQWLLHPRRVDLVKAYDAYVDDLIAQIRTPPPRSRLESQKPA